MDDNIVDWKELVDLYVDGECSREERRLVQRRAEQDATIRAEIEFALKIRDGLRGMRTGVPVGFDDRLQEAIADAWFSGTVPQATKRCDQMRKSRMLIRICVGLAAMIVVSIGGVVYYRSVALPASLPIMTRNIQPLALKETIVKETAPNVSAVYIMTPVPEGELPASVSKRDSQNAFWAYVEIASSDSVDELRGRFQRLCGKLDVRFIKSGNDLEYALKGLDEQQWSKLASALKELGTTNFSRALSDWNDCKTKELKDVRVVFCIDANVVNSEEDATIEE